MSVAAIQDRDPSFRRQRREAARWLASQIHRTDHCLLHLAALGQSVTLIAFLALLATGINRLVVSSEGTASALPFGGLLGGMLLALFLRAGIRLLSDALARRLAREVTASLRADALAAGMTPAARLRMGLGTAELTAVLTNHLAALTPWYTEYLPARALAVIQSLAILIIAISIDWVAGLVLLLTAPLIPLFSALIGMGTATLADQQRHRLDRLGRLFLDRIRNLVTLRLLRAVNAQAGQVATASNDYRHGAMEVLRLAFLSSAVLEFFSAVAIASLAIYIGLALLGYLQLGPANTLGFGEGLFLLLLAPEFFNPLRRLAGGYHERATAMTSAATLRPVAETAPSPRAETIAGTAFPRAPRLSVRRVTAGWPGAPPLIKGLDLTVNAGEWLAVCGPSGSGKSLLAATLLGWAPPVRGQIFLDDRPLHALSPDDFRRTAAWLGQQPHLLPDTLRRNLDPGGHYDDRTLEDALDRVALTPLLGHLPGGLDARLGERGAGLSGGEAQRLALARALLGNPGLLVLDEPTASLDPDNRAHILDTLASLHGTLTLVMMTHDEGAAGRADQVIRLDGRGPAR